MSTYPHVTTSSTLLQDLLAELPSFAAQIVNEHRTTVGGLILCKVRAKGHDIELDGALPMFKVGHDDLEPTPEYQAFLDKHRVSIGAALRREQDSLI